MARHLQYLSKQKLNWLILFFLSTSILAANSHIYLSGTLGTSTAKIGNSNPKINYHNGTLTDAYPTMGNDATTTIVGISSGYQFVGAGLRPAIAVGLGVYTTPKEYNYKGQLIETTLTNISNTLYTYKYNIRSTRIMAEVQFTWLLGKLAPFINMGVGSAWNSISGYKEAPIDIHGYTVLPPFQSHTNTNFAYQAGFGVGYVFNFTNQASNFQHEQISLGYRYVDLGPALFGTRGASYPYRLNTGRLRTNDVYLNYMHLF